MTGKSGAVASQTTIPSGAPSTRARQASADQLFMTSLVPVSTRASLRSVRAVPDFVSIRVEPSVAGVAYLRAHAGGPTAAARPARAPPSAQQTEKQHTHGCCK